MADPALARTRLIMLSSVSQRGHGTAAQRAGIAAMLTKPVRQSHLFSCLLLRHGRDRTAPPAVTRCRSLGGGAAPLQRPRARWSRTTWSTRKSPLRLLEKLGCRVDVAANGLEAVELLAELAYDLVFMDCQMPEMDGFEATPRDPPARGVLGAHVPIIAMTANAMQGDREQCLAAGMDDYLSKPVSFEALAAAARKWAVVSPQRPSRAVVTPEADAR